MVWMGGWRNGGREKGMSGGIVEIKMARALRTSVR